MIQLAQCANAAANLGYPTTLLYLDKGLRAINPVKWIHPFQLTKPDNKLSKFYSFQEDLQVAQLPAPWPIDRWGGKWTSSSTLISKYYFPFRILPHTQIVHTRDWNFVKMAVKHGIAAIYERDHYEKKQYEPEIVNSPFFQLAVTVIDTVRDDLIRNGMPSEKTIKCHNGFNRLFLRRHPETAELWRQKLLKNEKLYLIVYSGALFKFKGVDLLVDIAKEFPEAQFVFAGGDESQVQAYQELAREKVANNVIFLGHLPQEQLAGLLQAADILAHPHCSGEASTFTSPMKFFDYLAAGVPIVATEISSLREFKSSSVVAGWCQPDDPSQFLQTIRRVLETHPRKPEGYSNTMEFVRQFSWENRIAKILSYVDESMRPTLVR